MHFIYSYYARVYVRQTTRVTRSIELPTQPLIDSLEIRNVTYAYVTIGLVLWYFNWGIIQTTKLSRLLLYFYHTHKLKWYICSWWLSIVDRREFVYSAIVTRVRKKIVSDYVRAVDNSRFLRNQVGFVYVFFNVVLLGERLFIQIKRKLKLRTKINSISNNEWC